MTGFSQFNRGSSVNKSGRFIPHDISEALLFFLRNDTSSLKQSSLVCRSWNFACRVWLFENINLDPNSYEKLLTIIETAKLPPLFMSRSKALTLQSVNCQAISTSFTKLFTSISSLCVQGSVFSSLEALFDFAAKFSNLNSITFKDVAWKNKRVGHLFVSPFPAVRRFEALGQVDYEHLFKAILHSRIFPSLLHITAGPMGELDVAPVVTFLGSPDVAQGLQSLTLSSSSQEEPYVYNIPIRLSPGTCVDPGRRSAVREKYTQIYRVPPCTLILPNLRLFRIDGFINVHHATQGGALLLAPRSLSCVIMPALQCFEMTLVVDRASQLDQYGIRWEFLDCAFSSAVDFPALEKVVFIIGGSVNLAGVSDLICSRLPRSTERGILYYARAGDQRSSDALKMTSLLMISNSSFSSYM